MSAALSAGRASARTRSGGMPTWRGDRLGRRAAVAGQEPDVDPGVGQLRGRRRADSGLHRVADRDETGGRAVDGDIRGRPADGRGVAPPRRCERRRVDAVLDHHPFVPDEHGSAGLAAPSHRPRTRPHRGSPRSPSTVPETELVLPRTREDRGPERMLAPLLEGARRVEDLARRTNPPPGRRPRRRGRPSVNVPVLSMTTASTRCAVSSASPPRMRMPASAPRPVPTMIAVGVARPIAHGQAMTSDADERGQRVREPRLRPDQRSRRRTWPTRRPGRSARRPRRSGRRAAGSAPSSPGRARRARRSGRGPCRARRASPASRTSRSC